MEVGATPIKWILAQRRINFLHHILCKENNELVKKVFKAQKEYPTSGDFVKLVEQDMEDLNITYTQIQNSDKMALKASLKKNATNVAFNSLKSKLMKHKKVKHIKYESLKIQPYLRSNILHTKEKETLTALRSKCVRNVRFNFTKNFKNRLECPLQCDNENPKLDSQEHLLICTKLNPMNCQNTLSIEDSVGKIEKQEKIAKLIFKIIIQRKNLLEEMEKNIPS